MQSVLTMWFRTLLLLASGCCFLPTHWACAQLDGEFIAADTSSPRATLKSFLDASNEISQLIAAEELFNRTDQKYIPVALRVLDCIDASELPAFAREERAAEVAVCLKEILDRYQLPPWEEVPDAAAIENAGGFENLSRWRIPGTRITIARVEDGPQKHEYLFSAGTVDRAVEYFHSIEAKPYRTDGPATSPGFYRWYMSTPGNEFMTVIVNRLPERLRYGRSFGLANWKWPGLLITVVVAFALMAISYRFYFMFVGRTRGGRSVWGHVLILVFPLAAMLLPMCVEHIAHHFLTIRGTPLYVISFSTNAIATLAGIVIVFAACGATAEVVIASPRVNPQGLNAQLIRIAFKLLSFALAVVVFLIGGQYIGIPVATLLASAGIGGVALALGAQDTLKTLFGTVMLMADKPFRVGERIIFKEYDGVVEDIGMRSTKLRLLTTHQVTIPNDELARSDIENVGRRQSIRRVADIQLPLDTPYQKIEMALAIVRKELENHEGMQEDYPPRVYFLDFLPSAFTIRVFYWYHPAEYWDYLAFSEKFNFAIFRAFEEQGIQFSLPHRITPTSLDSQQVPIEIRMMKDGQKTETHGSSSPTNPPK